MTISFTRLGAAGSEIPVAVVEDAEGTRHYDLRPVTGDIDGAFLDTDGPARAAAAIGENALPEIRGAAELRIGPPIARPHAVVCVGMNYAAHAAEGGSAPPEIPIIFMKMPNTIIGPNDTVPLPPHADRADWEVELGIVIGHRAHRLASTEEARAVIAGFVVANDLSERTSQLELSGGQWSKGKNFPSFLPLGPRLVPAEQVDHGNLRLRSSVNGEARQDSTTADMIFSVEDILLDLSRYMAFEPGDLILTGTPEGVALSGRFPYLAGGDVMELEIEGLGRQRQTVEAIA